MFARATEQKPGVSGYWMSAYRPAHSDASGADCRWMSAPIGFTFEVRKSGDVVIRHHDRVATVLRGRAAARFLADAASTDLQARMARLTGNYKHGNEPRGR
jgi:hypothetical protein